MGLRHNNFVENAKVQENPARSKRFLFASASFDSQPLRTCSIYWCASVMTVAFLLMFWDILPSIALHWNWSLDRNQYLHWTALQFAGMTTDSDEKYVASPTHSEQQQDQKINFKTSKTWKLYFGCMYIHWRLGFDALPSNFHSWLFRKVWNWGFDKTLYLTN